MLLHEVFLFFANVQQLGDRVISFIDLFAITGKEDNLACASCRASDNHVMRRLTCDMLGSKY
jgi:hypothetical protein